MSISSVSRRVLLIVVSLALAACITQESPPARFYVLGSLPAETPALPGAGREPPVSVDIAPVRLPQYLERPQMVVRVETHRLELAEFDRWAGSLEKDVTRVLAQNLAVLLATPEVTIFSRRPPAPADARVEVEILRFERGPDRRVVLAAQWRLLAGANGAPLLARMSELASDELPPGGDMGSTAAAMSELLARLCRDIGREVLARAAR